MNELIYEIWHDQKPLVAAGIGFFAAAVVLAGLTLVDSTEILGVNRWIKPVKFAVSAAIFLLTVAVYLFYLDAAEKTKNVIVWGTILIMFGEVFLIVMQSARGTTSHFNTANHFDGFVFSTMGFLIAVNTFLVLFLTFLYFQTNFKLPAAILWGMRLGLIVFLAGSLQGGFMASQTGHGVGAADGGAGLPFVNWSTTAGDLRVAHFLGLHAFQTIPLFAVAAVYLQERFSFVKPTALTVIFAAVYFAAFTLIFAQALAGKPLLKTEVSQSKIIAGENLR